MSLLVLCSLLPPTTLAQAMLELPVDVNEVPLKLIEVPRTSILARIPLLRSFLRAVRPNTHVGRKSDYRSEFDENFINYHAAQLWKIAFNVTRKRGDNTQHTESMQQFLEKFAKLPSHPSRQQNPKLLLLRSIPGFPTAAISSDELYENTLESLQWLMPVDIRQFNIFSPQSSYQINMRYRNSASVKRYYGYQLWKVHENDIENEVLRTFWQHFGAEVWNINQDGIDILIDYKNTAKAKDFIAKTDFTYNVMIDDIETAIDETYMEVNNSNANMPWLDRENTIMNWNRYHDIGDIQQFMQHILETYPDVAEIVQIGVTHYKRPLEVLRISNGNPKNWAIFIDAGMQARDWLTPAALTSAISKLTWLWDQEPAYMRNIDWYFLPVANPDGYQYSRITDRLWSKNRYFDRKTGCYGVNLNRNFDYQWGGSGASENPCKNLYRGPKQFSEPETKAIRTFLHNMREYLGAYVSFGAYGQAITYPWGDADYVTDNQRKLHYVARRAMLNFRKLNEAEYRIGTSYRLKLARAGNSADWVQQRINPQYVYNVFLKDQGRYGYLMPPHYIVESGEEAYEFMKTVAAALN
ncbi:carboxypeptidase B [Rhagoletis pomonella]|uniref:carboxypeptidase B n=1 Tax=Rhagoletis pomonella TaxID=28610 RepID=UPI00177AD0A6|nr:carboxypeptidase B [Rhagoletis pomonella]